MWGGGVTVLEYLLLERIRVARLASLGRVGRAALRVRSLLAAHAKGSEGCSDSDEERMLGCWKR